ncbi:uncharacterized protein LOC125369272 [Ricinus communis]|uniref:uncharacterized protein LOC125369272 n=1 Tax=Ricinus communis TaxID=3988 RepID=UPI00201A4177|nr:uncharacterized protein LOC125369272 [Ricinus communis]
MAERQPRILPSNTESNLREHVKAITLRSGKQLSSSIHILDDDDDVQVDSDRKDGDSKVMELEMVEGKKKSPFKEYQPLIPYLARLKQEKVDQQFDKFLDSFKQLRINLPFVEAISQMPSNTLADLGASINLMSYSLFTKLRLGETKPTRMSIQLADRTVKYPRGIVENVLVKVDKFIFYVDFVIMDMDGESNVPLILGRPFLATSRAIIDIYDGKLEPRVGDETLQEILLDNPLQVALQAEDEHELSN